nr:reverse transcriptase domain-containing protein [Tanacetum cinerariifolium]
MVPPTNNGSTKDVQPPVVQSETPILNSEPVVAPIIEPVVSPVSALKPNRKPSIPYPSRLHDQKLRDKTNDQKEKFFKIFQDFNFNISFADALILMPILADPGTRINLLALSVWKKLSLPELSPMCMILELADRLISRPVGVAEDVFIKTERALIDVFKGELTLCVGKVAITFNLDQTSRYSANYNDMTANRIDVIDMAYEEYSQKVLSFFNLIASGNPTPYYGPIVSTSSSTLTPFGDSDFLLDEVDAFLALEDDATSLEELKTCEAKTDKSSIDEPLKIELKDLPPNLEYAFLEGDDKLPVIIEKSLSDEEKIALIKILMEDDFEPTVQHQRRVNPKIHDVIKKEVLKLLDAELIYPISNSPWVSPVHCVPKRDGFIIFENEENELISTRLVTGCHVCIDYHKLNEATRKDHFPLPFIDQMLKRLAGNEYYCFLDGFSGYFEIPIDSKDQEKTTFMCPYGENHFMVKEGIVLSHKISKNRIEVDKAKVDVITKLPHPTTVKGIDFIGPFPSSRGNKYILVAVDYLSKWVKAKALPTNDARVVCKFLKSLFARFGTLVPSSMIMLVYRKACYLLIELEYKAYWALKHVNFDLQNAGDHRKVQLNELNELHNQAIENSLIYKEKTKRIHDSKIKDRIFNIGDQVLLFNFRLKIFSRKVKTHCSGPFTITHAFPYGTVELS